MASLIPLALGGECYAKGNKACLQSHEAVRQFSPSALSRQQMRSSLPPQQLQEEKQQPRPERSPEQRATATVRANTEWKTTLGEIKMDYVNRRFRQCSTRCHEILALGDNIDLAAHPVHLVYVRFYAALALEMQARAVHHSSPIRISLLKQAHHHYSIASDLASQADQQVSRRSSHARISRLSLPSLHSPAGSNVSASLSSPTSSLGSRDDTFKPSPKKKKVAFRDEPIIEPIIRPDSPTLGFEEWLSRSSPEPVFPESILKPVKHTQMPIIPADVALPSPDLTDAERDPFFHTRSIHRFCTILSSIRRQISSHLAALHTEITACQTPTVPEFTNKEMKVLDIQARIERLRSSGWNRPRFNIQRYQALRENALADIAE